MQKKKMLLAGTVMALSMLMSVPAFAAEDTTQETEKTGYVTANLLNVRNGSSTDYDIVDRLKKGDEVTVVEEEKNGWYEIRLDGALAFISGNYITYNEDEVNTSLSSSWTGPVLSSFAGTITGPSGKETYYNLNMSTIVSMMHSLGYSGEYWVRSDGVKMFGDYVMVAANLSVHPRGSIVATSLGDGIVCDTGGFASYNPTQLDIATTW